MGLMGSLLLSTCGSWPVGSTERVEVKIDGVVLRLEVEELGSLCTRQEADRAVSPIGVKTVDAAARSRESHRRDPSAAGSGALTRRSLGEQVLSSWAAGPLLDAMGELMRVEDGERINRSLVLSTLEQLLEQQETVSTLDVLEALPVPQLRLDLDGLVAAANRWRLELKRHQALMPALARSEARLQPLSGPSRSASI